MLGGYATVKDISEKWGLKERTVQMLCSQDKVDGAVKFGTVWAIPESSRKPTDGRITTGEYKNWRNRKSSNE